MKKDNQRSNRRKASPEKAAKEENIKAMKKQMKSAANTPKTDTEEGSRPAGKNRRASPEKEGNHEPSTNAEITKSQKSTGNKS